MLCGVRLGGKGVGYRAHTLSCDRMLMLRECCESKHAQASCMHGAEAVPGSWCPLRPRLYCTYDAPGTTAALAGHDVPLPELEIC